MVKKIIKMLVVIFCLVAIAVTIFFLFDRILLVKEEEIKNQPYLPPIIRQKPSVPTTSTVPADWQTYRNEEYGFEVEYPNDWRVELVEDRVIFTSPGVLKCRASGGKECGLSSPRIGIFSSVAELPNNEGNLTFEEWFMQGQKDRIFGDKKPIKIRDYEGIDVVESGMIGYRTVLLFHNSKIAYISVGDDASYMAIFNQILASFRFLD